MTGQMVRLPEDEDTPEKVSRERREGGKGGKGAACGLRRSGSRTKLALRPAAAVRRSVLRDSKDLEWGCGCRGRQLRRVVMELIYLSFSASEPIRPCLLSRPTLRIDGIPISHPSTSHLPNSHLPNSHLTNSHLPNSHLPNPLSPFFSPSPSLDRSHVPPCVFGFPFSSNPDSTAGRQDLPQHGSEQGRPTHVRRVQGREQAGPDDCAGERRALDRATRPHPPQPRHTLFFDFPSLLDPLALLDSLLDSSFPGVGGPRGSWFLVGPRRRIIARWMLWGGVLTTQALSLYDGLV